MPLNAVLIVLLVVILLGVLPIHSYSASWGTGYSGGVGLVLLIVIVLILMGRI